MYILECADNSFYTGSTKDLELRLAQHQAGMGANHTKRRLPVTLVYFEEYQRIDEAFYREKQIQGWSRKKKKALINKTPEKLHGLAECQNDSHYGFGSAQPAGDLGQSAELPVQSTSIRSLSEAEGKSSIQSTPSRSLSGAEGKGSDDE
jgi:putative endonuclease